MTDPELRQAVREALHESGITQATLIRLLIDKGVFTAEEYERMRLETSARMDQMGAEMEDG